MEVEDTSTDPPVLVRPEPLAEEGRGVLMIDALADQWGTEMREDGKTVWFEIGVAIATAEVHGN